MENKLEKWLAICALILSIGGVLYSLVFKPTGHITDLQGKVVIIEYRLDAIQSDIKWIRGRLK